MTHALSGKKMFAVQMSKKTLSVLYTRVLRCCGGVKKKKIIFTSFEGKSYSDNPRSISEALHEMMPDARIYWLLVDAESKRDLLPNSSKAN